VKATETVIDHATSIALGARYVAAFCSNRFLRNNGRINNLVAVPGKVYTPRRTCCACDDQSANHGASLLCEVRSFTKIMKITPSPGPAASVAKATENEPVA
jgi:hypothetical protein